MSLNVLKGFNPLSMRYYLESVKSDLLSSTIKPIKGLSLFKRQTQRVRNIKPWQKSNFFKEKNLKARKSRRLRRKIPSNYKRYGRIFYVNFRRIPR